MLLQALQRERKFPIPWGLLIALGVYGAAVAGYVALTSWSSPEYQASKAYQSAWRVLGRDEGRHCTRAELEGAYADLVRAAQLLPSERRIHEDLESLNWRFEERRWKVPAALRSAADAQAALMVSQEHARDPMLAVGLRERGWDPQGLLAGPARTAAWSLVGVAAILIVWAYLRFSASRVRAEDREAQLQALEREVAARGAERRAPKR